MMRLGKAARTRMGPVVFVTALLSLFAATLGLSLGGRLAPLTESEVIEAWAASYVSDTGGQRTDCAAVPGGRAEVWLTIRCGHGDRARVYPVNRRGQLVSIGVSPAT